MFIISCFNIIHNILDYEKTDNALLTFEFEIRARGDGIVVVVVVVTVVMLVVVVVVDCITFPRSFPSIFLLIPWQSCCVHMCPPAMLYLQRKFLL